MERRASKAEFEALKRVAHLAAEIIQGKDALNAMAADADCINLLSGFVELEKNLLAKLTDQLPMHQRGQLLRHVSDMKVAFTSPVAVSRDEAYVYVPRETLLRLIQSAVHDKCALCLCQPEDVRRCQFRQAVNDLRMDHVPDDLIGCTVRLLATGKAKGGGKP